MEGKGLDVQSRQATYAKCCHKKNRSMEKIAWNRPQWGREDLVPTNPNLANVLGRTDFDSDNFLFL